MAEKMVRCIRCHDVFDAELGPCLKCGTPYKPPVVTQPIDGLYSERYAAENPPTQPAVASGPPRRRESTSYFIWGGIGLVGVAVVIAIVVQFAGLGGAAATPAAIRVIRPAAMPTDTLPPTTDATIKDLNDIKFSAHITVQSRIQLTTAVAPKAQVVVVKYDGIVSGGNQWGTLKVGTSVQDAMLVDGEVFTRAPSAVKWTQASSIAPYKVLSPIFGLQDTHALAMIGQETKNGQVLNHLQATHWWRPDISRLAMYDLSNLRLTPDVQTLDLWVKADGTPVFATYDGTIMAGNTTLFAMHVEYTFSDVGAPVTIAVPGADWTPSPGPPGSSSAASAPHASAAATPKK